MEKYQVPLKNVVIVNMFRSLPKDVDSEADQKSTCKKFLQVQKEGEREVKRLKNF